MHDDDDDRLFAALQDMEPCSNCGTRGANMPCMSGCKAYYCNRECMLNHASTHRLRCRNLRCSKFNDSDNDSSDSSEESSSEEEEVKPKKSKSKKKVVDKVDVDTERRIEEKIMKRLQAQEASRIEIAIQQKMRESQAKWTDASMNDIAMDVKRDLVLQNEGRASEVLLTDKVLKLKASAQDRIRKQVNLEHLRESIPNDLSFTSSQSYHSAEEDGIYHADEEYGHQAAGRASYGQAAYNGRTSHGQVSHDHGQAFHGQEAYGQETHDQAPPDNGRASYDNEQAAYGQESLDNEQKAYGQAPPDNEHAAYGQADYDSGQDSYDNDRVSYEQAACAEASYNHNESAYGNDEATREDTESAYNNVESAYDNESAYTNDEAAYGESEYDLTSVPASPYMVQSYSEAAQVSSPKDPFSADEIPMGLLIQSPQVSAYSSQNSESLKRPVDVSLRISEKQCTPPDVVWANTCSSFQCIKMVVWNKNDLGMHFATNPNGSGQSMVGHLEESSQVCAPHITPGDVLYAVNGHLVDGYNQQGVLQCLAQAPKPAILRFESMQMDSIHTYKVPWFNGPLGLTLKDDGTPQALPTVHRFTKTSDTTAMRNHIAIGDMLIAINNIDTVALGCTLTMSVLKKVELPAKLTFRGRGGPWTSDTASPLPSPEMPRKGHDMQYKILWTDGPLGLTIIPGEHEGDLPIVKRVTGKGTSNGLESAQVGDVLVQVDDVIVKTLTFDDLVYSLKYKPRPTWLLLEHRPSIPGNPGQSMEKIWTTQPTSGFEIPPPPSKVAPSVYSSPPAMYNNKISVDSSRTSVNSSRQSVNSSRPSVNSSRPSVNSDRVSVNSSRPSVNSDRVSVDSNGVSVVDSDRATIGSRVSGRKESASPSEPPQLYEVIWKEGPLGLTIDIISNSRGAFIKRIALTGGISAASELTPDAVGDRLVSIQGQSVEDVIFTDIVAQLKQNAKPITLTFAPDSLTGQMTSPALYHRSTSSTVTRPAVSRRSTEPLVLTQKLSPPTTYVIEWTDGSLGMALHEGPTPATSPFVGRLTGGGCAKDLQHDGVGDVLSQINGSSIQHLSFKEVMEFLKNSPKPISLTFLRNMAAVHRRLSLGFTSPPPPTRLTSMPILDEGEPPAPLGDSLENSSSEERYSQLHTPFSDNSRMSTRGHQQIRNRLKK